MGALRLDGCRNRIARAREDEEERVSLSVHLDAVGRCEGFAHDPSVRAQELRVCLAEPLEELRRVLDVGEDEGDRSAR